LDVLEGAQTPLGLGARLGFLLALLLLFLLCWFDFFIRLVWVRES
jgi:hypothetical protein